MMKLRAAPFARWAVRCAVLLGALLIALPVGRAAPETPAAIDVATSVRRSIERVGRELGHGLQPDPRLAAAALALAQNSRDCASPSRELIEESMWRSAVLEPSHRLMLLRFAPESLKEMLADLPSKLTQLLGKRGQSGGSGGKWSRYAFSSVPLESGERCGVIVVLETFVTFAPARRALPIGQSTPLGARLQAPYHKPRLLFTPPSGDVTPLPLSVDKGGALVSEFTCAAAGRFLIELLAEDVAGPSVLAKFPIDCGQSPPTLAQLAAASAASAKPAAAMSVADAEQQIFDLINAERKRAGRTPLTLDPRLAAVARAYSEELHRDQFIAHVSPRTGSPGDRVRRAGIATTWLAENLVKAPDARSAHRELMESPGHRASLLDPQARWVGIGAALTQSPTGEPWIIVTELFAVLAAPN